MTNEEYIKTFLTIVTAVSNHNNTKDVDPILIASIGLVESHYDPDAKSSKGAMGIFQFTNIAIKHVAQMGYIFNPGNVKESAIAAEIYFSYLLKNTDSVEEALIAWNMGITSTIRLDLGNKNIDYKNIADMMNNGVYRESANFVIKVMKAYSKLQEIYSDFKDKMIWWIKTY